MKPPTDAELTRLADRFNRTRIESGDEMGDPLALGKAYVVGGEYVGPEEMVRRVIRRCLELTVELRVRIEDTKPTPPTPGAEWNQGYDESDEEG